MTPPESSLMKTALAPLPDPDLLESSLSALPPGATVLDYGCYGWSAAQLGLHLGRDDLDHLGVDLYEEPPGRPTSARYLRLSHSGAALPRETADLVIASHVLEHCADAVGVFGSLIAAVRTGGAVYVEAPSELTALQPSDPDVEGHAFTSFWDDPNSCAALVPGGALSPRPLLRRQARALRARDARRHSLQPRAHPQN